MLETWKELTAAAASGGVLGGLLTFFIQEWRRAADRRDQLPTLIQERISKRIENLETEFTFYNKLQARHSTLSSEMQELARQFAKINSEPMDETTKRDLVSRQRELMAIEYGPLVTAFIQWARVADASLVTKWERDLFVEYHIVVNVEKLAENLSVINAPAILKITGETPLRFGRHHFMMIRQIVSQCSWWHRRRLKDRLEQALSRMAKGGGLCSDVDDDEKLNVSIFTLKAQGSDV